VFLATRNALVRRESDELRVDHVREENQHS